MSGHKKWENWIMTMWVGDWQSESDMEGIPNCCDLHQNRFLICWNIWLKRKEHYIKYKWRCCKLLQMVVSKSLVVSCGAWGTLLASATLWLSTEQAGKRVLLQISKHLNWTSTPKEKCKSKCSDQKGKERRYSKNGPLLTWDDYLWQVCIFWPQRNINVHL